MVVLGGSAIKASLYYSADSGATFTKYIENNGQRMIKKMMMLK
jgi:hypothetical protein